MENIENKFTNSAFQISLRLRPCHWSFWSTSLSISPRFAPFSSIFFSFSLEVFFHFFLFDFHVIEKSLSFLDDFFHLACSNFFPSLLKNQYFFLPSILPFFFFEWEAIFSCFLPLIFQSWHFFLISLMQLVLLLVFHHLFRFWQFLIFTWVYWLDLNATLKIPFAL